MQAVVTSQVKHQSLQNINAENVFSEKSKRDAAKSKFHCNNSRNQTELNGKHQEKDGMPFLQEVRTDEQCGRRRK